MRTSLASFVVGTAAIALLVPGVASAAQSTHAPAASAAATTSAGTPTATRERTRVWADGRFVLGRDLDVYGTCANGASRATLVGPHGMRATMSPMADSGSLGAAIRVPRGLKGSWIRLTMTCKGGGTASTIAYKKR